MTLRNSAPRSVLLPAETGANAPVGEWSIVARQVLSGQSERITRVDDERRTPVERNNEAGFRHHAPLPVVVLDFGKAHAQGLDHDEAAPAHTDVGLRAARLAEVAVQAQHDRERVDVAVLRAGDGCVLELDGITPAFVEHFPRAHDAHRGLRPEFLAEFQPETAVAGFVDELFRVLEWKRDVPGGDAEPILRMRRGVHACRHDTGEDQGAENLHGYHLLPFSQVLRLGEGLVDTL